VLHQAAVTQQKIQQIRKAGIKAGVWTVNDEATMAQMLKMGIDRIYTDCPKRLLAMKAHQTNTQAPRKSP
jgi:glycerophosphoryl diester phosphodiesterase